MPLIAGHARELLDAAPDAMIVTNSSGAVVYANDQAHALFGYARGQIIGDQIEVLLPERFQAADPILRTGDAHGLRLRPEGENLALYARHRDGSEFRVEISLSALQTDSGLLITNTIRDLTAGSDPSPKTSLLSQTPPPGAQCPDQETTVTEAREHAIGMLNSIGDAVISTDLAGNVSYLNSVAEKMTGWSLADATGTPIQEVLMIIDDGDQKSRLTSMKVPTEEHNSLGALMDGILTRRDGTEFAVEHAQAPIQDNLGEIVGAVLVFRGVTLTRSITQKLAYAAQHDALTELPNRMLVESRLTEAIVMAARHHHVVAVLFLDLDGFKSVNDTLGHIMGDRLLKSVASLLQRCVRSADTVGRFGGDEFVILLSEIAHSTDAIIVAKKILNALGMVHVVDQHSVVVSASIGIGLYPDDCTDAQTALRHADDAMFRAKRRGGNAYQLWN